MPRSGPFILALDEGTTGTSAVLFDEAGQKVARSYEEIPQFFPKPGWVEHDAEAIWLASQGVLRSVVKKAKINLADIQALGITNQRETIVAWDGTTGKPLSKAIVWQCRRTADLCEDLKRQGAENWVREKTGLVIDPYFSGSKVRWYLENDKAVQRARSKGTLRFGTIDSWLLYRLTGRRVHGTDPSNASRTLLMDLGKVDYDDELLDLFNAKREEMPAILDSAGDLGVMDSSVIGREIPITGIAGDQQAALFGQGCVEPGMTKNTYGTGCFVLTNAGKRRPRPPDGILATIGWRIRGKTRYALEGSVFIGGAVIQWLRDGLKIIKNSKESESLARSSPDDGGVVLVPAFTGLGAPHWDPYARGAIFGLTRGTGRGHLARAALQSIALQSAEVVEVLAKGTGKPILSLRVDGGATENSLLLQYQADLLGIPVERSQYPETTAQGAAFLAGIGVGLWKGPKATSRRWRSGGTFEPKADDAWRRNEWRRWNEAVRRTRGWASATT